MYVVFSVSMNWLHMCNAKQLEGLTFEVRHKTEWLYLKLSTAGKLSLPIPPKNNQSTDNTIG